MIKVSKLSSLFFFKRNYVMLALECEQWSVIKHHQKLPAPAQTVSKTFKKNYRLWHLLVHCRWCRSFPNFVLIWKWKDYGMNLTSSGLKWLLQRLAGKWCFLVLLAPKNMRLEKDLLDSSILQYLYKKDLNEHWHEKDCAVTVTN